MRSMTSDYETMKKGKLGGLPCEQAVKLIGQGKGPAATSQDGARPIARFAYVQREHQRQAHGCFAATGYVFTGRAGVYTRRG